jgi:hypothetical protein
MTLFKVCWKNVAGAIMHKHGIPSTMPHPTPSSFPKHSFSLFPIIRETFNDADENISFVTST